MMKRAREKDIVPSPFFLHFPMWKEDTEVGANGQKSQADERNES